MVDTSHILRPDDWVNNYADELFRYALGKTGNSALAEDLVQESFLSGLKSREAFRGQSSERTWLYAILKNIIANHYRKASTRYEIPEGKFNTNTSTNPGDYFTSDGDWQDKAVPRDWQIDPIAAVENKELATELDKCINKLSPDKKQVILLKLVEDFDTKKICKDLNLSDTNLWTLIHRAKLQLRACLEMNWMRKK